MHHPEEGRKLDGARQEPVMVVRNEVSWDSVPYDDARNYGALPVGAVRIVIAYMAVQVERLVRTEVDHLACTKVVHLGSSEALGMRGVYTLNVLGHASDQGAGIATAPRWSRIR